MTGDELHEFVIAHGVGGALGDDGLFELGRFAEVVHELLLNGAAAGDVNLIRVHQMVADLFEELVNQGDSWILGMAEDGEQGGGGVIADDGRMVRVQPDSETLLDFV